MISDFCYFLLKIYEKTVIIMIEKIFKKIIGEYDKILSTQPKKKYSKI